MLKQEDQEALVELQTGGVLSHHLQNFKKSNEKFYSKIFPKTKHFLLFIGLRPARRNPGSTGTRVIHAEK